MAINVLCNSPNNLEYKTDTNVFVQKPFLRAIFIEANIGEEINMKKQFIIKNLPCPEENSDTVSKS